MTSPAAVRLPLPPELGPDRVLEALAGLPHRVLLESCGSGGRTLLSAAPRATLRWADGRGDLAGPGLPWSAVSPLGGAFDPFEALDRLIQPESAVPPLEPGTFAGGWIGYLGAETGDVLERLPPAPKAGTGLPSLWLGAFDWAVVWGPGGNGPRLEGAPLGGGNGESLRGRMEEIRARLSHFASHSPDDPGPACGTRGSGIRSSLPRVALENVPGVWSTLGREGFQDGVERIREYIRAGDLFQANLTHFLGASFADGGIALYRRLRSRSPAPFAAYLDTGEGEVVSVSPESFLSLRGRRVETRPIKGTAPRDPDPVRDGALAQGLLTSGKDRAENVMIVDLLRNDLSRVCRPGSVRVPRLLELESHPTVHHLVSTVEGELEPATGPVDLLRATLPAGSVTGAPKIRALEVLRELEPVRRGAYTGALGLLEAGGDLELSVAIRTAVVRDGQAMFGVGGGITLDSDPEAEWRESLDKGAAFLQAVSPTVDPAAEGGAGPTGSERDDATRTKR